MARPPLVCGLVALFVLCMIAGMPNGVAAQPDIDVPSQAWADDHNGLSNNESVKLFSGDTDQFINDTAYSSRSGWNRSELQAFLNGTDWQWETPPSTAQTWTQNDVEAYRANFSTSTDVSKYPSNATLEDDSWIRDAHASVFSIHPGTRMRLSPQLTRPLYAPNGTAYGLIDYWVSVPEGSSTGDTTISWSLDNAEITDAWVLQGDGNPSTRPAGSRTVIGYEDGPNHVVSIPYDAEPANQPITLSARIEVTMKKEVRTVNDDGSVDVDISYPSESTVVGEIQPARIYQPNVTVQQATFPNGDHGVALSTSQLIDGASVGNDSLDFRWDYYAARDPDWDTIHSSGESGGSSTASPVHPVAVYGFPIFGPPTATRGLLTSRSTAASYDSPNGSLPSTIDVVVREEPYNVTSAVGMRFESGVEPTVEPTSAVAGVEPTITNQTSTQVRATNLSLRVLESNMSEVLVEIRLEANATGDPIELQDREGYVDVDGKRVNTNASGRATVRVPNHGATTATYEPAPWSSTTTAYASAKDRVIARTGLFTMEGFGGFVGRVFTIFIGPLIVLRLLDLVPTADTWPPWRLLK